MAFDVEGARKAGYSDAEIAQHLAAQSSFDLAGAKSSGYSDSEVIAHLAKAVTSPGEANSAEQLAAVNAGAKTPEEVEAFVKNARAAPKPAESTAADKAIGAVEAGVATISGLTGVAGGAVGILQGISNAITRGNFGKPEGWADINEKMKEYSEALTYTPRTAEGQEQAQAVGQALMPLAGHAPELGAAVQGAGQAAKVGGTGAAVVLDKARTAVPTAMQKMQTAAPAAKPTPGTMGSAGAAATDAATQRQALADQFGIPRLTKGQATRDPMQLKFERETAKTEAGGALRERSLAQEEGARAQLDRWVDETGAEKVFPRDAGMFVDDVLRKEYGKDKAVVRTAYNTADKSAEAKAPIDLNKAVTIGEGDSAFTGTPIDYLNSKPQKLGASTALTDYARAVALKLGIAAEADGQLVAKPATMKQVQTWRREISQNTGIEPAEIRDATIMKRLIDAQADPVAGPLYQQARAARTRLSQNYENHRVISRLINEKRGTTDRQVAFEDVFDHSILRGSTDDVRQVRRVLQRAGPDGHQAWAELRGQTLRWVREQATPSVAKDSTGNKVISPAGLNKAINQLDADGRLEVVFGKKGAQQLRDINDLVQDIKTVPPEAALNNSNTAATLAAFADVALSGSTGIPAPLATSTRLAARYIRDVRLRRRILEALGEIEAKKPLVPSAAPPPNNAQVH